MLIKNQNTKEKVQTSFEKKDFKAIYRFVSQYVSTLISDKDTAKDISQEIIVKIWQSLEKGSYKENGTFKTWCLRVTYNYVIDFFRKQKRKDVFIAEVSDKTMFNSLLSESAEDIIINKEIKQELLTAISKLSPEQQKVITLRIYEDMSFKDIAKQTQESINTILGRYRYACKNLLKILLNTN